MPRWATSSRFWQVRTGWPKSSASTRSTCRPRFSSSQLSGAAAMPAWLRTWAGRSEHHLRRVHGDWRMAFKKVLLVNSDGETPALGFLV